MKAADPTKAIDILFKTLSDCTFGLIDDLTSAMAALVLIGALVLAFDQLVLLFEASLRDQAKRKKRNQDIIQEVYNFERFEALHEELGKKGNAERAWKEAEYNRLKGQAGDPVWQKSQRNKE